MSGTSDKWADLAVRLGSGVGMVILGLVCVWAGGGMFYALVSFVCGLMVWELVRMLERTQRRLALQSGLLAAVAAVVSMYLPIAVALPVLMLPTLYGGVQLKAHRNIYLVFTALVMLAGFAIMWMRSEMGIAWVLWLVLVVVATDVVGYFAGRMIGGPKFWPRISPKKTWAGTTFGWLGAAAVGAGFMATTDTGAQLLWISVAVSMASQIGDISESAIKRRLGVKDSSNLIPGHGGVLDRFDGMLGGAVFLLIVAPILGLPPGGG